MALQVSFQNSESVTLNSPEHGKVKAGDLRNSRCSLLAI